MGTRSSRETALDLLFSDGSALGSLGTDVRATVKSQEGSACLGKRRPGSEQTEPVMAGKMTDWEGGVTQAVFVQVLFMSVVNRQDNDCQSV